MAVNPQPLHITDELWWFVGELERLEPDDTAFAGAWGDFKPGYHADAYTLWWHKVGDTYPWRTDYSIRLLDDKVLGGPLEHFGAAVDWTFASAQAGDARNIRKYGGRVRAAFLARDPRLKGWREVLIQGDADAPADGYDFVSWTERTPDETHKWHGHFSCLRKYLKDLKVFEAMISVLRGETLDEWKARGADMIFAILDGARKGAAGRCGGGAYQFAKDGAQLERWRKDQGGVGTMFVKEVEFADRVGVLDAAAALPAGGGITAEQARAIVDEEIDEAFRAAIAAN